MKKESRKERKKEQQNDSFEKGKVFTLAVGWEDSDFIPEGLILKLLLAGETFNFFLLEGFSKKLSRFSLNPNCLVQIIPT